MVGEPVTLGVQTLLTMIRWRRGEPHPVLAREPAWYDDQALRALDESACDELAAHGLSAGGELTPEFDDVFGAVFRPRREFYGWLNATGEGQASTRGVLAGVAHEQGFLLVREYSTDTVTLWSVETDELFDSFLAQIPPVRAADRRPVSGDYDALRRPGSGTTSRQDTDALRGLLERPRLGAGSLYTARREPGGARVRCRRPVNYIDTPEGRWVFTLRLTGGRQWVTATPADRALIAARLDAAVESRR